MRWIVDVDPSDPALGLAIDEALLDSVRRSGHGVVRLWVNERAIVVGRAQRVDAEVDVPMADRDAVSILRRISGGGSVFHHPGNLIVSVCVPLREAPESVSASFRRWGAVICEGLTARGAEPRADGNRLVCDGRKLGGAAQVRRGGVLLYHTTILVESDALSMRKYLLAHRVGYAPQGIASRPEEMTCLEEIWRQKVDIADVMDLLSTAFACRHDLTQATLSESERAAADALARTKYSEVSWTRSRTLT